MSLRPDNASLSPSPLESEEETTEATLQAFSAYDLPSVEALVKYFHAAVGYPVRSTWLKAIEAGNYDSWPGLSFNNAARFCPSADETIKGHLVQTSQGKNSSQPKKTKMTTTEEALREQFRGAGYRTKLKVAPAQDSAEPAPGNDSVNKLHVKIFHQSKLYTDDTRRFPIWARSSNQYVMVGYHSSNMILIEPFSSRKDKIRLAAYDRMMQRLKDSNLLVDLQILDNECSKEYERRMKDKWGVDFQLVPPDMHRRNAAERAIRTFKAHFLAILAGVADDFPRNLWDLLLPQTEMTLNMLRQATAMPTVSAWEYFHGKKFNYGATPLGPLGINVLIHAKPGKRKSWDFRGKDGWSVGVSLKH